MNRQLGAQPSWLSAGGHLPAAKSYQARCLQPAMIYSDDDHNVPFLQTTDLIEKLRAQNVAFEELRCECCNRDTVVTATG